MNARTLVFIALAGASVFATTANAGQRHTRYEDSWMYAQPQSDATSARAQRAEPLPAETPRFATPTREQELGNSANGS